MTQILGTGAKARIALLGCVAATLLPLASSAQETVPEGADAPPAVAPMPTGAVAGLGDVNLYPRRLVLDGRTRVATIGLYNRTANQGDYEISLIDMAMTPDGQLLAFDNGVDPATQARVRTAGELVRFSPRRVSLLGNEAQTVRVMARPGAELPPGEYRSHFTVVSVPPDDSGLSIDEATGAAGSAEIGVTIRPRFGISIPVILRVGETTLQTGIADPQVLSAPDGSKAIAFTITRAGTRSAYGDITVSAPGSAAPVALSRGIGVYPEVDSRAIIVPVDPAADPALLAPGRSLTITFTDDDFAPGSELARQTFVVR